MKLSIRKNVRCKHKNANDKTLKVSVDEYAIEDSSKDTSPQQVLALLDTKNMRDYLTFTANSDSFNTKKVSVPYEKSNYNLLSNYSWKKTEELSKFFQQVEEKGSFLYKREISELNEKNKVIEFVVINLQTSLLVCLSVSDEILLMENSTLIPVTNQRWILSGYVDWHNYNQIVVDTFSFEEKMSTTEIFWSLFSHPLFKDDFITFGKEGAAHGKLLIENFTPEYYSLIQPEKIIAGIKEWAEAYFTDKETKDAQKQEPSFPFSPKLEEEVNNLICPMIENANYAFQLKNLETQVAWGDSISNFREYFLIDQQSHLCHLITMADD